MRRLVALGALVCAACSPTEAKAPQRAEAPSSAPADRLLVSFAWMGGCREGSKEWDPARNPSSANVAQLSRTLTDLAALDPVPRYLFFPGDMVLGLSPGEDTLGKQLAAWTALYEAHPSGIHAKTTLVPTMGNHEALYFKGRDEVSNPAAGPTFTAWLTRSGFDARAGNGPTSGAPNPDALGGDERKLTYSFDDGPIHFVVLDTDALTTIPEPSTGTTQIGWVPYHWLEADLAAAEARPATRAVFVVGHKPLVRPDGATERGDVINAAMNAPMAALLDRTTKVKGYLTSHDHLWDARRLSGGRGVWQIISGNGGSAPDPKWTARPPYFGFTVVRVYESGRVVVVPYRRPIPAPYDAPEAEPAKPGDELTIAP